MDSHIEQAVALALNPNADPAMKQQATDYCAQVQASADGWSSCLSLFVREPKSSSEARYFCLQVVDEVLQSRASTLDETRVQYIRQAFLTYIQREFVSNTDFNSEQTFLKNKFAHAVALFFRRTYLNSWTSFFTDMLSMVAQSEGGGSNKKMLDLFLRVLGYIDEEVVNTLTHRTHTKDDNVLNVDIKDRMRERDVAALTNAWFELLAEYKDKDPVIAGQVLHLVGLYVSWIDITLIVNERFVNMIYSLLLGSTGIRDAAADCLTDIVKKGMKPEDKLELISILGIVDVVQRINIPAAEAQDQEEFVGRVARLLNNLGLQLCQIWHDSNSQNNPAIPPTVQARAYGLVSQLIPMLLQYLQNTNDTISGAMFGFLREVLGIFKAIKKASTLPQEQKALLRQLLEAVVVKMKYGEDMEWACVAIAGGSDSVGAVGEEMIADEEVLNFLEMRRELKRFFDAIAALSASLTTTFLHSAVTGTLTNYVNSGGNNMDWRDLELALYLLYLYGEAVRGAPQYIVGAPTVGANGGKSVNSHAGGDGPLTPLGQCLYEMAKSNVSAFPHPSVSANFFEIVCRYTAFFEVRNDCIPDVLGAFVDTRGLHHPDLANRARAWYLFWRFTKELKARMTQYVPTVLSSIQDVLQVQATLPSVLPPDFDLSTYKDPMFETKTYVFEAVGLLISQDYIPPADQLEYVSVVVSPLLAAIQKCLEMCQQMIPAGSGTPRQQDLELVWILNHELMALGSVAKGFPDVMYKKTIKTNEGPCGPVFKQIAETTLVVLKSLSRFQVIRSSARFTFGRLISCLGEDVQPYLPTLIEGLLQECSIMELVDFLPFLSQVSHKFKSTIHPILNQLLYPLLQKVFMFLNQLPTGTDEAMALVELRKAYLAFLQSLFASDLETVLISELNGQHLTLVLQSVLHYALDPSDVPVERMAFGIFARTVQAWAGDGHPSYDTTAHHGANGNGSLKGTNAAANNGSAATAGSTGGSSEVVDAPGFQQFLYEHIIPATFEAPMKPAFDIRDGQSAIVMGEISVLQKSIYGKQGPRFLEYLQTQYLPSMNCPAELSLEYAQALQQLDAKSFKKYFMQFIQKSKS